MFPLMIHPEGIKALVVGAGAVAERKIKQLVDRDIIPSIVAAEVKSRWISSRVEEGTLPFLGRRMKPRYLKHIHLLVLATDDPAFNRRIAFRGMRRNILVNNCCGPGNCDFPAFFTKGPLCVAVSTSGENPGAGAHLCSRLESGISENFCKNLSSTGKRRREITRTITDPDKKKRTLNRIMAFLFAHGDDDPGWFSDQLAKELGASRGEGI